MDYNKEALKLHEENKGKISINLKVPLENKTDLSLAYTPGVAEPCRMIAKDKNKVYDYTIKGNSVAVISDGSAVLGLGNIGGEAAMPVMEGKAALFKRFANIDAYPICLKEQDIKKTIETIKNISCGFGGINLEDFKSPECFEIEDALQDLGIPVMHDDQHGTAIVVLAGLYNALKIAGKKLEEVQIVVSGAGAAAIAITKLLISAGANGENVILVDRTGMIYEGREDLQNNKPKLEISKITNGLMQQGTLFDAIRGSDVFIGVSSKGLLTKEMVKSMASKSIIFAMANPEPEIMPIDAKEAGVFVIATGRSDFANQVNNVLAFPGIFRGALDCKASRITNEMKLAAARALADLVENPSQEMILPLPFDERVVNAVSEAVKKEWK
jgi:malate dehydrogenase (oxaloacetate-decarboxylating)